MVEQINTVEGMVKLMGVNYRQREKHIGLDEAKVYEKLKELINTIGGNEINVVTDAVSEMFLLLLTIPKNEAQRYLLINTSSTTLENGDEYG